MKKKIFGALFLALCLVAAALSLAACGETEKEPDGDVNGVHTYYYDEETKTTKCLFDEATLPLTFSFDETKNVASVTGTTDSASTQLCLPEAIRRGEKGETYPVVSVSYQAFKGNTALKSVVLPSSLTVVEANAFEGCSSLDTVEFSVNGEGKTAVSEFQSFAFAGTAFKAFDVPESVVTLGNYVFNNCTQLASVTLPSSLTEIGLYAFKNCAELVSVTIPASVSSIGNKAFEKCEKLTSVTFAEGSKLSEIKEGTFLDCASLTSLEIPQGVQIVGVDAFRNCAELISVSLKTGVTEIRNRAFSGCAKLESISLPFGVSVIGNYAFDGCSLLSVIEFDDDSAVWQEITGEVQGWNSEGHSLTVKCADKDLFYTGTNL